MNKEIKIILNILLISILVFSIFKLCSKLYDYKKADLTYNEISKIKKDDNSSNLESYMKLKKLNSDYKFWIEIENTNVNYPVMQTKDNSYYLKKDFYKKDSSSGSVFLDYRNTYTKDFNNVLYGHNMKNQTIFNDVENYKIESFFNQNNKIIISDDKYKYIYEPFSVYITDGNTDGNTHIDINSSMSQKDIANYLINLKKKSLYPSTLQVLPTDKIITLVTCSYEGKDVRTIVHAKLINTEIF